MYNCIEIDFLAMLVKALLEESKLSDKQKMVIDLTIAVLTEFVKLQNSQIYPATYK